MKVADYWDEIKKHDPCAEAVEWVAANPDATVDDVLRTQPDWVMWAIANKLGRWSDLLLEQQDQLIEDEPWPVAEYCWNDCSAVQQEKLGRTAPWEVIRHYWNNCTPEQQEKLAVTAPQAVATYCWNNCTPEQRERLVKAGVVASQERKKP
jgi:hypothetical protein